MTQEFDNLILEWPMPTIRDVDIATAYFANPSKRYALVNRALKKGSLVRLRRGVYLIGKPYRRTPPSHFEIAHSIYGPGYISFESALSYHLWIPEAVYTTTCATAKRATTFETPVGLFQYAHVPNRFYYLGVQRVESDQGAFLIAEPWKALADHFYVHKRNWKKVKDLYLDLRIEKEDILESNLITLKILSENYQSKRVCLFLSQILKEIS